MANPNDGKFFDNKISEGNPKGFPTTIGYFRTTGKKITAGLTMVAAFMLVISAATNFFPDLPQQQDRRRHGSGMDHPRFFEGGKNDRKGR